MTEQAATSVGGVASAPTHRLKPDAIGAAQDTVIGMASSAPAATVGLSLAALAAATAYGSGLILLVTAVPMLVIANAYRRLNLWNANCGASFEWVGRAINPYLGFITGWLMIAAYILGTVAEVLLLGPSVVAVFNPASTSTSTVANVGIGVGVGVVMLAIAIIGIRITARIQVGMALVEYLILIGIAIVGMIWVLGHHPGHPFVPFTSGWMNFNGIGGGSAVNGFLIAVFVYGGWDGSLYVNEEVRHRRVNPGRAAVIAVVLLAIIYTFAQVGFQGVVSRSTLAKAPSPLITIAQVLGGAHGGTWAKAMALSIALSVIATTGTGIVLGARLVYGMANYQVLPRFFSNVSRKFATPVAASAFIGLLIIAISVIYFLATSVHNAFQDVINVTSFIFSVFYILTALASMVYYRRRVVSSAWNLLVLGVLPLGAAGFLGWVLVGSLLRAPSGQLWSLLGIVVAGLILMIIARLGLRSSFFGIPRESERTAVT